MSNDKQMRRCLPVRAVTRAQLLVGAVRDDGADTVEAIISPLSRGDLYALTVTLAAMVPDDQSPADLLSWNDTPPPASPPTPRRLQPHGTHAAYNRHASAGEQPCGPCLDGERVYQRNRGRRRRATVLAAVPRTEAG